MYVSERSAMASGMGGISSFDRGGPLLFIRSPLYRSPEKVLADHIKSGVVYLERRHDVVPDFQPLAIKMYDRGLKISRKECR